MDAQLRVGHPFTGITRDPGASSIGRVTTELMLARAALLHAQYASPIITKDVTIEQKLNNPVSLDLFFRDEANQTVALRTYFGEKPVVCVSQHCDTGKLDFGENHLMRGEENCLGFDWTEVLNYAKSSYSTPYASSERQ